MNWVSDYIRFFFLDLYIIKWVFVLADDKSERREESRSSSSSSSSSSVLSFFSFRFSFFFWFENGSECVPFGIFLLRQVTRALREREEKVGFCGLFYFILFSSSSSDDGRSRRICFRLRTTTCCIFTPHPHVSTPSTIIHAFVFVIPTAIFLFIRNCLIILYYY